MNQDIKDALARLTHALDGESRANDLLRIRLAEQEQIVTRERGRADAAERALIAALTAAAERALIAASTAIPCRCCMGGCAHPACACGGATTD